MTPVSIVACIVVLWAAFHKRFGSVVFDRVRQISPSPGLVQACGFGLVPAFLGELALLYLQTRYENVGPQAEWLRQLPFPVYDYHSFSPSLHPLFCACGYAISLVEVVFLAIVCSATQRRSDGWNRRATTCVAVVLATLSIAAPAMSTTDPYEYVAAGMLGMAAYAPSPGAFAHTAYATIFPHIPLRGVLYGPLWLALDTAATWLVPSIIAKLLVLRLLNALLVAALMWLLARAGTSRTALTALALNPAVWNLFVVNAHADIQCLVVAAAAFLVAQRSRGIPAMLLVVAAGLIKLPFVLAGAAAFAPIEPSRRRLALWLGAGALVFALSYLVPGPVYLNGIFQHANYVSTRAHARGVGEYVTMIPFDFALMAAYVAVRFSAPGAAWFFGQLSPVVASWYLFWGLPYAANSGTLTLFLIPLPMLTTMLEFNYRTLTSFPQHCVVAAVLCAFGFDLYLSLRRRFAGLAGVS